MLTTNAECILGVLTDKAKNFIKKNAKMAAEEKAKSADGNEDVVLQKHRYGSRRFPSNQTSLITSPS